MARLIEVADVHGIDARSGADSEAQGGDGDVAVAETAGAVTGLRGGRNGGLKGKLADADSNASSSGRQLAGGKPSSGRRARSVDTPGEGEKGVPKAGTHSRRASGVGVASGRRGNTRAAPTVTSGRPRSRR